MTEELKLLREHLELPGDEKSETDEVKAEDTEEEMKKLMNSKKLKKN